MTDGFLGIVTVEGDTAEREALLDKFNALSWASNAIIDIFSKGEDFVDASSTTIVRDNKLRVPTNAAATTAYTYLTDNMSFSNGSITKLCPKLLYDIPDDAILKMEITTNNSTWLNVFQVTGGVTASPDFINTEITTGFTAGQQACRVRLTLTTNSSALGPRVKYYAIFTDPDPS